MANQNLFEKYGIKEVADVTFYRIERKNEVYESQREISVSSILKGAITTQMVYPMDNGKGADTGFEAYVFSDADVLTHANYDCDDILGEDTEAENTSVTYEWKVLNYQSLTSPSGATVVKNGKITAGKVPNPATLVKLNEVQSSEGDPDEEGNVETTFTVIVEYEAVENSSVFGSSSTHEYSYAEQVLMLFAKKQNLIKKTGVRYQFTETDIFENLEFNDEFAEAPNSTEKVVVLGLAGNFDAGSYLLDDVTEAIKMLNSKTYKAKAYDVTYKNYAELVVDDEMGYFNPNFLAETYKSDLKTIEQAYAAEGTKLTNPDPVLANAEMWKENSGCLSINDAIDALRKKKKSLDQGAESTLGKIKTIEGGYSVSDDLKMGATDVAGEYSYSGSTVKSSYALDAVLEALNSISALSNKEIEKLVVSDNGQVSNRAIYVSVDNVDTAASAYIYLLRNVDYKKLSIDEKGIFTFTDRNGNTVYYQDTIFAGVEYLALVIVGTMGLIFKVDRHGTKKIEQIAWMVNENGYITDKQAEKIVDNGLIHTVDVDVNDETFEATCTVSNIKVRKINKTVNRYVPVLFLDTLKVSTLEQTAEQTAATGGKGNAQLIIWDYGKEITLTLQDALYSPASMSAMLGSYEGNDFTKGVKETKRIDRTEKCVAKRSFIVPAGNSKGVPSEGENTAQAVYIDLNTMQPYQDGAPIAEGEVYLKWTRSVAYGDNSLGNTIEISAEKFPGTYKVVGDTYARSKATGEDQRFQFVIPQAKMSSEQTITLEAEGDPTVFDMKLTVLRPDDGVMVKLIQYDVVENEEENDGSTMVKDTENLNLLDDAEMFKVSAEGDDDNEAIGATEY